MKAWESEILAAKQKDNRFVVVSGGAVYLCNKINGEYIVKNKLGTKLTQIDKVTKL